MIEGSYRISSRCPRSHVPLQQLLESGFIEVIALEPRVEGGTIVEAVLGPQSRQSPADRGRSGINGFWRRGVLGEPPQERPRADLSVDLGSLQPAPPSLRVQR
jgi:hypothetical protein